MRVIPTLNSPKIESECLRWLTRLQEELATIAAARAKIAAEKIAGNPNVNNIVRHAGLHSGAPTATIKPAERAAVLLAVSAPPASEDPLAVLRGAVERPEGGLQVPTVQEPPEGTTVAVSVQGSTLAAAGDVPAIAHPAAEDRWASLFAAEMARAGVVKGYDRDWIPILRRLPNPEAVLEKLKSFRGHGDVEDFVKLVKRRLDAPKPVAKPTAVLMPLVNPTPQQQASWEVDRLHPLDKNTKTYRDFQSRVYRLMDSPENRRNPRAVLVQLAEIHSTTELNAFLNARNCP